MGIKNIIIIKNIFINVYILLLLDLHSSLAVRDYLIAFKALSNHSCTCSVLLLQLILII